MSSGFVTEKDAEVDMVKRQEEWERVRKRYRFEWLEKMTFGLERCQN
jgi:hypothetical protein